MMTNQVSNVENRGFDVVDGEEGIPVFVSFGFGRVGPSAQRSLAWSARDFSLFKAFRAKTLSSFFFSSSMSIGNH